MSFNDCLSLAYLQARQTYVLGQVYRWRKPELCLAFGVRHMDVNPSLLAGEEKQSELAIADDSGCHVRTVADQLLAAAARRGSSVHADRR
jgi:hypothetical protein